MTKQQTPVKLGVLALIATASISMANEKPMTFTFSPDATTGTVVSREIYGMNVARWDHRIFPSTSSQMLLTADREAIRKLKDLQPSFLKYPGGNDADSYLWNSPTNPPADMDTDEFLAMAKACDAAGFFTVNFTKTPELAAEWVRYTNKSGNRDSTVPYWEVGDEVWGEWAKSHTTGGNYAKRFREFAAAMKAVDPGIKLAANLHLTNPDTAWTKEALEGLGDSFDIITTTFFPLSPPNENDEKLFNAPNQYRDLFRRLESYMARQQPNRQRPKYCLVGFNSTSSKPGPQTVEMANAVFMAQMYAALGETGTDMACWWAYHNEWKPRGGDFGIVTSDAENKPYYTWHVLKMLSRSFHGRMLASEQKGDVEFYVTRGTTESLCALLINKSPRPSYPVTIALSSNSDKYKLGTIDSVTSETGSANMNPLKPDSPAQQWDNDSALVPIRFQSLQPYSVNMVMLEPRNGAQRSSNTGAEN